ncbi:acyl-CoA N-acyltransferase [Melanomma pulvis-pyrius CBS 109.77]|uniref:Acyl-CoA N-acyltransferase n=1 Tax=Melanomma pulvis-pyrius CBS 109.77 TaxID=1314802 RepID=A0A6A6XLV3_9PLEO|nr:acyl-CoA N-acyltransferase [Melanomma pulvis-pyrius CBS 109.77]
MFIRQLARSDFPDVLAITTQAFAKDELFDWLHPHQDKYPNDLRRTQRILLRNRLVSVGSHGFVIVTDETDPDWSGTPEITGYAFFMRSGNDELGRKWQTDSLFNKFERHLLSWELSYETNVLNRISDRARVQEYRDMAHYNLYSKLDPRWHLGLLAVSVNYQRRGIGGKLVKYGQKLAAEENLPLTLESSVAGRGLYLRSGFKIVDESEVVKGLDGLSMVWEPDHLKGKWLEDIGNGRANILKIVRRHSRRHA